jgi:hypothetical protein
MWRRDGSKHEHRNTDHTPEDCFHGCFHGCIVALLTLKDQMNHSHTKDLAICATADLCAPRKTP